MTRPHVISPVPALGKPAGRIKLEALDGLRGLAAFYVVLGHCHSLAIGDGAMHSSAHPSLAAVGLLGYPHFAVAIFIVLSGCCLMLPVARSADGTLAGGIRGFVSRRARRILPPYYVALAAGVVVHLVTSRLGSHAGQAVEEFSGIDVLCHFLLLHNLFPNYNMALNAPMWSVALEWQIYFVFALILLPVWRRLGMAVCVAVALAIGYAPLILLPGTYNLNWTCPWYVGLFAFGMVTAVVISSDAGRGVLIRNFQANRAVLVVMAAASVAAIFLRPQWLDLPHYWVSDLWFGLFAALLICSLGNTENPGPVDRSLNLRPMKLLGAFSYSLYLIHAPILYQFHKVFERHGAMGHVELVLLIAIGVPICLCAAYVFHRAFERPFMSSSRSSRLPDATQTNRNF